MSFQPSGALDLNGSVQPTVIVDPGALPTTIVKANTPFRVRTSWEIHGTAVPLIAGDFHLTAYFERFGGGSEPEFGPVNVPVTSAPLVGNQRNYTTDILIPAGLPAGAYELMVLVTYTDTTSTPGPIAGFPDNEVIIQIFP
jgi:hypothetical protein